MGRYDRNPHPKFDHVWAAVYSLAEYDVVPAVRRTVARVLNRQYVQIWPF